MVLPDFSSGGRNGPTIWKGEFGAGDGEAAALPPSVAVHLATLGTGTGRAWRGD